MQRIRMLFSVQTHTATLEGVHQLVQWKIKFKVTLAMECVEEGIIMESPEPYDKENKQS